ncbi:MAG: hypothetical protein O4803_11750 [Trichodesmium sp. St15_bin1_1]|nr:hypothetical protein [Trichodesmium sp. St15_bin1_1]MDE5120359.1 hypothetical protein [Trichodesmium sp. St19_bin1]
MFNNIQKLLPIKVLPLPAKESGMAFSQPFKSYINCHNQWIDYYIE